MIWLEFIFILSSIPSTDLPPVGSDQGLFWAHRTAHILEYSILGILLIRAYAYKRPKAGVLTILFLSVFVLLSGVFDEWHQSFVPGRQAQFIDVFFDTVCGAWGMLAYRWAKWRLK